MPYKPKRFCAAPGCGVLLGGAAGGGMCPAVHSMLSLPGVLWIVQLLRVFVGVNCNSYARSCSIARRYVWNATRLAV